MVDDYRALYEKELLESVIPFWERYAPDTEYGGFFTFLDRDGSVYDTAKYMWMQWRIVFIFAELERAGYQSSRRLDLARRGFDFLYRHGRDDRNRYYFALDRRGRPTVAPYNIFSDGFAAMGSAALYSCTGEDRHREAALEAMRSYRGRLEKPKAQWEKQLRAAPAYRRLGHYMMMANLGLCMQRCLHTDEFAADVETAAHSVLHDFWNPEIGVIFENVRPDGSFDLQSCTGRMLNPGHALESLWFLLAWFADRTDARDYIERAVRMIRATLEYGWDRKFGGLYYFMDAMEKPHVELQWDMKLWWVHCEALMACLYGWKLAGDEELLAWFERIHDWTWRRFPDPGHGEWFGYLNRRGEPTHLLKGGKWKTCFHLPRTLLYALPLLPPGKAGQRAGGRTPSATS